MARPAIPEASRRRFDDTVERLRALLPDGWRIEIVRRTSDSGVVSLVADDGTETEVTLLPRERLEPRDLDRLPLREEPSIVSAGWLSPRSRELLRARQVGYLDRTGNAEVRLRRPALYVRTDGAARDPSPKAKSGPTLRGPKAWALLRTLIEVLPPYTAGDLAATLGVDDGYVSRVLQVLTDERLIVRRPRGAVTAVHWEPLLRQVTTTYSLFRSNETSTWVAGAGPEQLLADLKGLKIRRWAATGSFAASAIESVTAPAVAVIYAEDPERVAKEARLLPTRSGANVVLARPYDPIVFTRGWDGTDFPCVSVAQIALDCLTGSARMPEEGEAVVEWMRRDEPRWRCPSPMTASSRRRTAGHPSSHGR